MTRKEALTALLRQVERGSMHAGTGAPVKAAFDAVLARKAHSAYCGSLDAAKALHDAVLPGWEWTVGSTGAAVYLALNAPIHSATAECPARAWLIAILRALIAQEGGE